VLRHRFSLPANAGVGGGLEAGHIIIILSHHSWSLSSSHTHSDLWIFMSVGIRNLSLKAFDFVKVKREMTKNVDFESRSRP
jgi:hypothetical protein